MKLSEVKELIRSGDKVVNTFKIRGGNYYEVYRDDKRILTLTYKQFSNCLLYTSDAADE